MLEPHADGFPQLLRPGDKLPAETLLAERAYLLNLTTSELTALAGGLRVLNANVGQSPRGGLAERPETLTNDVFTNLGRMDTGGRVAEAAENVYEGRDRATGDVRWAATAVDLVFGSNSMLWARAEIYASAYTQEKFVRDFVAARHKGHEPRPFRPGLMGGCEVRRAEHARRGDVSVGEE